MSAGSVRQFVKATGNITKWKRTVLSSGSYAIVGTMVIRISYQYTEEMQYEMTDRITQEFTRLDPDKS